VQARRRSRARRSNVRSQTFVGKIGLTLSNAALRSTRDLCSSLSYPNNRQTRIKPRRSRTRRSRDSSLSNLQCCVAAAVSTHVTSCIWLWIFLALRGYLHRTIPNWSFTAMLHWSVCSGMFSLLWLSNRSLLKCSLLGIW
jgi:hypothetical protein